MRCVALGCVLAILGAAGPVRAEQTPSAPAAAAPVQLPRPVQRVVVAPPPTPQTPPLAEVRTVLRGMDADVQRCADTHEPWPDAGPRPRLRLRVWLEPTGRFRLEVPETEGRDDTSLTPRVRINLARLHACLGAQVARLVGPHLRPFRGRRQKIERAFRIHVPGPPPPARELARRVAGRRAQLLACVPGSGPDGEPAELVVRATLGLDGVVRLTGLAVPESVPFELAARCVADELGLLSGGRVTEARPFEAALRYRFRPVVSAHPE